MNTSEHMSRSVMEDLWFGRVGQNELRFRELPEYRELLELSEQLRADFESHLSEEQKQLLIAYEDGLGAYDSFAEMAIFRYAFRLGARMMLEMLTEPERVVLHEASKRQSRPTDEIALYGMSDQAR